MLGKNLRKIRENIHISQRELGRRIGKTGQYISYLENTVDSNPSLDVLNKISEALGVTTAELIGNEKTGIQDILEEILDLGITIIQISEKTNISIDELELLASGSKDADSNDFDKIVNTFYGSFYDYANKSPRQLLKKMTQERRNHTTAINGLYSALSSYYKIQMDPTSSQNFIQFSTNNEKIVYTKEDFNNFFDIVLALFPNFKLIAEHRKNNQ